VLLKLAQIQVRAKSGPVQIQIAESIFILSCFPQTSMWSSAREVAAGDTVIIWLTREQIQPLVISPGKIFNTKFGNFKHSDFVGAPYGSKVVPKAGRGFIYLLRPTPELWTLALPHRTQILYLADIAFITSYLGIKKDSKVIEAGSHTP
jgi:tRNA (adenine57-N1/adenine58-N1)-methyltransferase